MSDLDTVAAMIFAHLAKDAEHSDREAFQGKGLAGTIIRDASRRAYDIAGHFMAERLMRTDALAPPTEAARGERLPNPTCPHCGDTPSCGDGSWRWAGDRWQHRCRDTHPQAGYFDVLAAASPPGQPAAQPATAEFDAEKWADRVRYRIDNSPSVNRVEIIASEGGLLWLSAYAAGLAARGQPKRWPEGRPYESCMVLVWLPKMHAWERIDTFAMKDGEWWLPQPPAPKEVRP